MINGKTYSCITKQHHAISGPFTVLRQRKHRPQEEVFSLLNQRLDARDIRIAKSLHDISANLLCISASRFPAITRL